MKTVTKIIFYLVCELYFWISPFRARNKAAKRTTNYSENKPSFVLNLRLEFNRSSLFLYSYWVSFLNFTHRPYCIEIHCTSSKVILHIHTFIIFGILSLKKTHVKNRNLSIFLSRQNWENGSKKFSQISLTTEQT